MVSKAEYFVTVVECNVCEQPFVRVGFSLSCSIECRAAHRKAWLKRYRAPRSEKTRERQRKRYWAHRDEDLAKSAARYAQYQELFLTAKNLGLVKLEKFKSDADRHAQKRNVAKAMKEILNEHDR